MTCAGFTGGEAEELCRSRSQAFQTEDDGDEIRLRAGMERDGIDLKAERYCPIHRCVRIVRIPIITFSNFCPDCVGKRIPRREVSCRLYSLFA